MARAAWPTYYRRQVLVHLASYLPRLGQLKADGLVKDFDLLPDQNAIKLVSPSPEAVEQIGTWPGVLAAGTATEGREAVAREDLERCLRDYVAAGLVEPATPAGEG